MFKYVILLALICSTSHAGITKDEGRRIIEGEDPSEVKASRHKKPSYKAEEGDKCDSNFDCKSDQYCRKANGNYKGVCVEKQR